MNQLNKLWKRKAKETTLPVNPAAGASTSATSAGPLSDVITTKDVLRNTSTFLEGLKNVCEASEILGPLKAICGVLKIATDTAVLLKSNGEDLKDLIEKLEPQQQFIESEVEELSKPEFSKLKDVQGLIEPLRKYLLDLEHLHDRLNTLKTRYNNHGTTKRIKTVLMAESDKDQIEGYLQKLEDSFRHFMNSVTNLIARQTLLMRNEMAALHKDVVDMRASINEKSAKDALSKLAYVNARGNQHEACAEGTRVDMLDDIARWAMDPNAAPILAIIDQAGTGKSTIATHMTRKWEQDGSLLSRFFFSKPSMITANNMVSTLAKDLAKSDPSLRSLVLAGLEEHDDFNLCSIQQQLEWLVFTPLSSLKETRVMVIDALDECSRADRSVLLKSILDFVGSFDAGSCPLKVLLTSRPEEDIISRVREPRYVKSITQANFLLHSEQDTSNESDIRLYMTQVLSNHLTPKQLDVLVKRANGLFIWASTAQAFISSALNPLARFEKLMEKDSSLNSLYDDILKSALEGAGDESGIIKQVLQSICVTREPLTTEMMYELLGFPGGIAQRVVVKLSSVLSDGSNRKAVYVLHPTFLDFVQDSTERLSLVSIEEAEELMARACLKALSTGLKYNIFKIVQPSTYRRAREMTNSEYEEIANAHFDEEISDLNEWIDHFNVDCTHNSKLQETEADVERQLRESTTPALRYAAIHGLSHVASSIRGEFVISALQVFFESNLLNWIELMGFYCEIRSVMNLVHNLKTRIEVEMSSSELLSANDVEWCRDILGMVQPFQAKIEESPMQVYFSALAFEPSTSNIYRWYHSYFAATIPKVLLGTRKVQSQSLVIAGHNSDVTCLAYSPDGCHLASGSSDKTVRVWDPSTGAAFAKLVDHTDIIWHLVYSPDGRYLASASGDGMVQIWNASTGASNMLTGHTRRVRCLAFSPDGQQLASGSQDRTVRIWNTSTGAVISTLTGHTDDAACLAFSPDGQQLASGSDDSTVRIWNASTSAAISTLTGHTEGVTCLAFSPDGWYLALGSWDGTVRVWNASSGAAISTLTGHTNRVTCLAFSPDGRQLASGSSDSTIRVWNPSMGAAINAPNGHTKSVTCLTFHSDGQRLALGNTNGTVSVYNASTGAASSTLAGHTDIVTCLEFSPDSWHLASGSRDGTVRVWNASTGAAISTLTGHTHSIRCLIFSPDGQQLASGSDDNTVRLWNASTSAAISTLTGHTHRVQRLAFSPDGQQLASGCWDCTVQIWNAITCTPVGAPLLHLGPIISVYYKEKQGMLLLVVNHRFDLYSASTRAAVWNLSVAPPCLLFTQPFLLHPSSLSVVDYRNNWTSIPSSGISFCLPSSFNRHYNTYEGRMAYTTSDGSLILIDCSHLLQNSSNVF